jgi:hypothetical protein
MGLKEIGCGLDSAGSEKGPVMVSCEHGNEIGCYVTGDEFLI